MSFFKDPFLYKVLAFLAVFIAGLFSILAKGMQETYFREDLSQFFIMLVFIWVPALIIVALFFYISKRLKRSAGDAP